MTYCKLIDMINYDYKKDDNLVMTKEASQILGLAKSTLEHWRVEGRGPDFIKFGNKVYYKRDQLQSWLTSRFGVE